MTPQRTLARPVSYTGTALHTGRASSISLHPAPAGSGYRIRRTDLPGAPEIALTPGSGESAPLQTRLRQGEAEAETVEHPLSACYGLGLDNVRLDLSASEPPAADGSASECAEKILAAGFEEQAAPRSWFRITRPFRFAAGRTVMRFSPAPSFRVRVEIDFPAKLIGYQAIELEITPESYWREIARARSFVLRQDLPLIQKLGLGRGATLKSGLLVDDGELVNDEPLTYPDEFVRHKALDLIGDLSLLGAPFLGRVEAERPGHASTVAALKALLARPECWRLEEDSGAPESANTETQESEGSMIHAAA